jgi:hypothetical protein
MHSSIIAKKNAFDPQIKKAKLLDALYNIDEGK